MARDGIDLRATCQQVLGHPALPRQACKNAWFISSAVGGGSATNRPRAAACHSCWPSFFVRPDGVITGQLRRHTAAVLLSTVDAAQSLYDATAVWRDRAIDGVWHSGQLVHDQRSDDRTHL